VDPVEPVLSVSTEHDCRVRPGILARLASFGLSSLATFFFQPALSVFLPSSVKDFLPFTARRRFCNRAPPPVHSHSVHRSKMWSLAFSTPLVVLVHFPDFALPFVDNLFLLCIWVFFFLPVKTPCCSCTGVLHTRSDRVSAELSFQRILSFFGKLTQQLSPPRPAPPPHHRRRILQHGVGACIVDA